MHLWQRCWWQTHRYVTKWHVIEDICHRTCHWGYMPFDICHVIYAICAMWPSHLICDQLQGHEALHIIGPHRWALVVIITSSYICYQVSHAIDTYSECDAVCCSVLQCVAVCRSHAIHTYSECVAVCCSVLQCVAVCCSVLQCVAVCCSHAIHTYSECRKLIYTWGMSITHM